MAKYFSSILLSRLRTLSLYVLIVLVFSAMTIIAIDRGISWQAEGQIFNEITQVPHQQVAVVLGTSKYLGRTLNEYYSYRVDAAIALYNSQSVDNFLLSGDNAHRSYNEPWTMKRDLLKAGVPEDVIHLDYAGFRTLDSIVRAKKIFDTDNFLIITQKFHCERAIFIANHHNIDAKCLAVSGPTSKTGYKVRLREVFARTKAFLDVFILHAEPKFLGPKEPIISQASSPNAMTPHIEEQSNLILDDEADGSASASTSTSTSTK